MPSESASYDADYLVLLDLVFDLIQSKTGQKIPPGDEWLNDVQILAVKLHRHLSTMRLVSAGSTIKRTDHKRYFYIDHASVKVVARAALETYLVFFHLRASSDQETSKFRHKAWRLAGLMDRQKLYAQGSYGKAVLAREKMRIEELKTEIEALPQFSTYTSKQKKQILEGNWRAGQSWAELGAGAGFHPRYFKDVYGYLCGYSHSSYISALQVGQAQSIDDQQMLTRLAIGMGSVLMAHFSKAYADTFKDAQAVLAADKAAQTVADKWRLGPKDLGTYGL